MTTIHSKSANATAVIVAKLRSRLAPFALIVGVLAACSGGGNETTGISVRTVAPTTTTSGGSSTTKPAPTTTTVAGGVSIEVLPR